MIAETAPTMDEYAERIGARVRALREAAGLTQGELARRTGIHRPNIARIESGRHMPSLDTVVRIARALDVQPSAILSVLDEPTSEERAA